MIDDTQRVSALPGAGRPGDGRLEALRHELELGREIRQRLDGEVRRLAARIGALEAESAHLRDVLAERERYVSAIERSRVWRAAQALRRLAGRAW